LASAALLRRGGVVPVLNLMFAAVNNKTAREAVMARADAFETDFWKDANLRKVWDDIVPGEPRRTIPYTLTRQAIELYCKSVGEDHPVYFDEDYAKTTAYRGLIAPPSIHILLMFACTPADDWMRSPGTVNAGQSWSYNIPARPGDVITLQARALDKFIKRERLLPTGPTLQAPFTAGSKQGGSSRSGPATPSSRPAS
jgi:3-hydroxybutyryl-CoA dehydratase